MLWSFANTLLASSKGHCNVQQTTKTDPSLVYFVKKQRRSRKQLTDNQIKKLDSIGFIWETGPEKLERQWSERLNQLIDYKGTHGGRLTWVF